MTREFIYMFILVLIASSCNKDDVVTTPVDDFYRAKTSQSVAECIQVYEYTPAPGQFINETKTGGFTGEEITPQLASAYVLKRFSEGLYVSLGAFGGYVTVGFDHSIDNISGYDIAIKGNSFKGSSEPGIVWVMQDENGNGFPDDTWYELKGSETGSSKTLQNYSVTYFRPQEKSKPVKWIDSEGNEGQIDYLGMYHSQSFYYPLWIKEDSYTLYGTRLEPRNYDKSGNGSYWVQDEYEWGYVDNYSAIDIYNGNNNNMKGCNLFDISNAIDSNGKDVSLSFIDFVKVQTACNTKSGGLGENSPEVLGFYDYSMINSAI